MIDPAIAKFLVSAEGLEYADSLANLSDPLSGLKSLRKKLAAEKAAALIDQAKGRLSLARKHSLGLKLHTTHLAAQQASSEALANYRAARIPAGREVLDICSSIGIDTLALSAEHQVFACDADEGKLILGRANAKLAKVTPDFAQETLPCELPVREFAFCDPDRRDGGRRILDPEEGSPSLAAIQASTKGCSGLGVKLAPGAPWKKLVGQGELEFIQYRGELKELVLWQGDLARQERRATIIAEDGTYCQLERSELADSWPKILTQEDVQGFLLDPGPALRRSELAPYSATQEGFMALDDTAAYFWSAEPLVSPFWRCFEIVESCKPAIKIVKKCLARLGAGEIRVSQRGYNTPADSIRRTLQASSRGDVPFHLHFCILNSAFRCFITRPFQTL